MIISNTPSPCNNSACLLKDTALTKNSFYYVSLLQQIPNIMMKTHFNLRCRCRVCELVRLRPNIYKWSIFNLENARFSQIYWRLVVFIYDLSERHTFIEHFCIHDIGTYTTVPAINIHVKNIVLKRKSREKRRRENSLFI